MSLSRRIVDRLPRGTVRAARRVAVGAGLQQLITLDRAVRDVAEAVEENALLEPGLERRVSELEKNLLSVLEARHRRSGSPPVEEPPGPQE
jgi:hypothetical protein